MRTVCGSRLNDLLAGINERGVLFLGQERRWFREYGRICGSLYKTAGSSRRRVSAHWRDYVRLPAWRRLFAFQQ